MAFSKSLARSLAPEVRVNCVAPGWIKTKWGETASQYWQDLAHDESLLARWGTPEDVAAAVRFLASPAARFVTAQTVAVNGGLKQSLTPGGLLTCANTFILSPAAWPSSRCARCWPTWLRASDSITRSTCLGITVAALMTTDWIARRVARAGAGDHACCCPAIARAICTPSRRAAGVPVERGPARLAAAGRILWPTRRSPPTYGGIRHRNSGRNQPCPATAARMPCFSKPTGSAPTAPT